MARIRTSREIRLNVYNSKDVRSFHHLSPAYLCTFCTPYCAYNCALVFVHGLSGSDNKRFRYLAVMRVLSLPRVSFCPFCSSTPCRLVRY